MSDAESDDPAADLSKRDRLVNAWLAAGEDANVETVASLTDASESYASQVRQDMEGEGMSDEEVEELTVPELLEAYRRRLAAAGEGEPDSGQAGTARSGEQGNGHRQRPRQPDGRHQQPNHPQQPQQPDQHPQRPQQPNHHPQRPQQPNRHSQQPNQRTGRREPERQPKSSRGTPAQTRPEQRPRPKPPRQPAQQPGPPRRRQSVRRTVQAEDGEYVPATELADVDATLAVLEEAARFDVQHVPPQHHQRQVALAKLYVAQTARELLAAASERAVPAEDV